MHVMFVGRDRERASVLAVRREIESGNGDIVAKRILQGEQMSDFFGKPAFEDISLQFLRRMNRAKIILFEISHIVKEIYLRTCKRISCSLFFQKFHGAD